MVARTLVFLMLVRNAGVEDIRYFLVDEPADVTVCKLCGIAFGLAGDGLDTELVDSAVRSRRYDDAVTEFCEERKPERIVFIHVENARNSDDAARSLRHREGLIVKGAL